MSARGESRRPKTLSLTQRQDTVDVVFGTCATSGSKNTTPPFPPFRPSQVSLNTLKCSLADGSDCQIPTDLHSTLYRRFDQLSAKQTERERIELTPAALLFFSFADIGQKPTTSRLTREKQRPKGLSPANALLSHGPKSKQERRHSFHESVVQGSLTTCRTFPVASCLAYAEPERSRGPGCGAPLHTFR
ncbi:hypothetical protein CGRA01v4_10187 [Colletotrichum graminicola]|nr:hypothetical protein CGRA01v4_10187 [Colletotrichum graminicola]